MLASRTSELLLLRSLIIVDIVVPIKIRRSAGFMVSRLYSIIDQSYHALQIWREH